MVRVTRSMTVISGCRRREAAHSEDSQALGRHRLEFRQSQIFGCVVEYDFDTHADMNAVIVDVDQVCEQAWSFIQRHLSDIKGNVVLKAW